MKFSLASHAFVIESLIQDTSWPEIAALLQTAWLAAQRIALCRGETRSTAGCYLIIQLFVPMSPNSSATIGGSIG